MGKTIFLTVRTTHGEDKKWVIKLKKLSRILTALCLCLLLVPAKAHASEVKSDFFTVDFTIGHHETLAPGDTVRDYLEIENTADYDIKVRIYDVDNVRNSKLYSVMTAGWVDKDGEAELVSFDKLTSSDWYEVKKGKTLQIPIDFHFPAECGNEYQGAELNARFIVESRIPKEQVGDIDDGITDTKPKANATDIPKTGDDFNLYLWSMISTVSGSALLILLLAAARRKKHKKA